MVQWLPGPTTYTTPTSSTRSYYSPGVTLINGTVYILGAYSDPFQGSTTEQPETYVLYETDEFGNFANVNQSVVAQINSTSPEAAPDTYLNYSITGFDGTTSGADIAGFYDTQNAGGTATFQAFVINTAGGSPTFTNGPSITVTPVAKPGDDDTTAHIGVIGNNAANNVLFEVEGAPAAGTTTGTYDIINPDGTTVVSNQTGFSFTDGKAHVFSIGEWNATNYAQMVEVWNGSTNLADVQLTTINSTTGVATVDWTAATEMESITHISWTFLAGSGAGMVLQTDGIDQSGDPGFVDYLVVDTLGGTGGDINSSVATHYTGTVTQDARIIPSGLGNNEFVQWWVDGNGLTIQLLNSSLGILETYNIAQANSTADVETLGDGRLLVTYAVQTSSTSAVQDSTILDTRLNAQTITETSGTNIVGGTIYDDTFDLTGGTNTIDGGGGWDKAVFDVASSQATISQNPGGSWTISIPSESQTDTLSDIEVAQFTDRTISLRTPTLDDFTATGVSDVLYRDDSTGDTGFYQIVNGANTGWKDIGSSSSAYTVVGTGDFTGDGTTDVLYRDNSTGDTGFYSIVNGANVGWNDVGASSTAYNVVGVGNFTGGGTDDILYRDNLTGDTGFYAIVNGANAGWHDVGSSSTAYSVVGVGDFMGNGTDDILYRDNTTGDTGFYQFVIGAGTTWHDIGASSTAYSVVGVGDFMGDGTDDILYRDNLTGDTGFYDIVNGVNTGWHDIGASSTAYSVVGVGDYLGTGTSDVLYRDNSTGDTGFYAIVNGANTGWHDIGVSSTAYHVTG
jgi:hypothetical protein